MVAYDGTYGAHARTHARRSKGSVLECDCDEKFALNGPLVLSEPEVVANGYWEMPGREGERRYSWLDDSIKWLEGKEAREEYYARLEQAG
jgi:hypothetical protein